MGFARRMSMRFHPCEIILAILGVFAATGTASAQTVTYGPILGRGVTGDQMIVKWGTSSASDGTEVGFRARGATTFQTVTGAASQDHEVVLTGLSLGAQYDYYVKSGATQSATNSFSTCPLPRVPMDVVFYGDSRSGPTEHARIVSQVLAAAPEMVFESGDIYVDGSYSGYVSEFFPAAKDLVKTIPFMAAPGNHDASSALASNYGLIFPSPRASGAAWQPYYAFTCGNAMFVGLDSNNPTDATQSSFLDGQLAAARGDATIDHVFVWFHHSAYSPGLHGDDTTVQSSWVPRFDDPANKVHAVFSGHDHIYARLHDGASGSPVYVVSGGAGAGLYPINGPSAATVDVQNSTYNFVKLHIAGGYVSATAYDDAGAQLDQFSFGMMTPAPDLAGGPPDLGHTSGGADAGTGGPTPDGGSTNHGSGMGGCDFGGGAPGSLLALGVVFALALRRRART